MSNQNFLNDKVKIDETIITEWYKGVSIVDIAAMLNAANYVTKTGIKWTNYNVSTYGRKILNLPKRVNRPTGIIKNKPGVNTAPMPPAQLEGFAAWVENNEKPVIENNHINQQPPAVQDLPNYTQLNLPDFEVERAEINDQNLAPASSFLLNALPAPADLNTGKNDLSENFSDPDKEISSGSIPELKGDFEVKDIRFYNGVLGAVKDKTTGTEYFLVNRVCSVLGVDISSQRQRIIRDETLYPSLVKITIGNNDDKLRTLLALPVKKLSIFLYGIKSNMVRESVKNTINAFKEEMENILLAAFTSAPAAKSHLEITRDILDNLINLDNQSKQALKNSEEALKIAKDNKTLVDMINEKTDKAQINFNYIVEQGELAAKYAGIMKTADPDLISVQPRSMVSYYIRYWVQATQIKPDMNEDDKNKIYKDTWHKVKRNFKYVTINGKTYDFKRIAENETLRRNKKVTFLDIVDEYGFSEHLLAFVQKHFPLPNLTNMPN